jgi:vanillate O-demethylase ferredoxin subunit
MTASKPDVGRAVAGGLRKVRIARRRSEACDVCSLDLVADDGRALPSFAAGSHVDVHLPGGLVRQYSLCGDPADASYYQLAVLKESASRGGSAAMHAFDVGERLVISEPRNLFPLAQDATSTLLIAGGIGITPLLAMAHTLARVKAPFELHYCARTPARAAFAERLLAADFARRVSFHFDDGPATQRWRSDAVIGPPVVGKHLYVCGPGGFIDHVLQTARAAGWPDERLHYERFVAAALAPGTGVDEAFEVEIASSGLVVRVGAKETIVEALAARGVDIPTSCEQGICGACVTRVLRGTPDHRDDYLTVAERAEQMAPCCSRAKSARLVLDL